jgi:hypothetical protein
MKRLLSSFKVLALAGMLLMASPGFASEKFPGCDDFIHDIDEDGTHWDCKIDAASEEWCYYQCTSH